MKHPISIKYIQYAQQGTKLGEYREVNPEDYVIDPVTYNRRNKYTGEQVTFLPEGMGEEGVVVTGKRIYPMFSPEQRAQKASEQNARDRVIASQYFNETPSIGNLVKGAYHFTRGTLLPRSENPEDYNPVQKLTAPDVPTFSWAKLTSLTRGKIPRLLQKVENDGPNLNVQAMKKIGGLPVSTGKTRTLKEVVGERPPIQDTSVAPRTFEEGVMEGYSRGLRKGTNQTIGQEASQPQDMVSKEVAREYAKRRVEKVQRDMDGINKLNKDNNQKRVERAFDLGKKRGESLAKQNQSQNVKPTESKTNTVQTSDQKLSKLQKLKQDIKKHPVKYTLGFATAGGIADITRVSVLNQDPTRDAKLIPVEIFNWVSRGLMSPEGRQIKDLQDKSYKLKTQEQIDSLWQEVNSKPQNNQSTRQNTNQNDTIQLQQMQPNKNVDNSDQVTDF